MSERKNIEELVRAKLGDTGIAPSAGAWKGVQRQLRMKQFLRFNPGQFNAWYLGGTLVAAAALVSLLTTGDRREELPPPSPEQAVVVAESTVGPEEVAAPLPVEPKEQDKTAMPPQSGKNNTAQSGPPSGSSAEAPDHKAALSTAEATGQSGQSGQSGQVSRSVRTAR